MQNSKRQEVLLAYLTLRQEVDAKAAALESLHRDHLRCEKGCAQCCVNLTVWPVEFFAIVEELKAAQIRPVFDASASCGFLKDGLCQIYASRPIICRTHGLPLVYLDDEQDEPAYGVMFCQKNFQDSDDMAFGPDNTLAMDAVNETLARLHTEFLEAGGESGPDGQGRIALSRLSEFLTILGKGDV